MTKVPSTNQGHQDSAAPDIIPDIDYDIGVKLSGYPILNPILNPISAFSTCWYQNTRYWIRYWTRYRYCIHADIRIPDIDPDIDLDIGYLIADIVSWCPDIMIGSDRVTPDIGTSYWDHRTRWYRETPDIISKSRSHYWLLLAIIASQ